MTEVVYTGEGEARYKHHTVTPGNPVNLDEADADALVGDGSGDWQYADDYDPSASAGEWDTEAFASKAAAEAAEAAGLDAEDIEGTGSDGKITKADVDAAAEGGE